MRRQCRQRIVVAPDVGMQPGFAGDERATQVVIGRDIRRVELLVEALWTREPKARVDAPCAEHNFIHK